MIILDTNVISEITKPQPNPNVLSWINRQPIEALYLTAINLAELMEGVALLPPGKRKDTLRMSIEELLAKAIRTPILAFDQEAALSFVTVKLRAKAKLFRAAGVAVVNPWEASS
jgi:predicted nucleic acid-binding protein